MCYDVLGGIPGGALPSPASDVTATATTATGRIQLVARNKVTHELCAIKFVPRGWDAATSAQHIDTIIHHMELCMAGHPHIIELKEVFLTRQHMALVCEYVDGETLEGFLEKVGGKVIEGLARFLMQQLLVAVDFCHKRQKLLRDIKLSNVLLSIPQGQLPILKLGDFACCVSHPKRQAPPAGILSCTPGPSALFAAPEVLLAGGSGQGDAADTPAADIWSCGVLLYVMLYGKHPFLRDQDAKLAQDAKSLAMLQRTLRGEVEYPDADTAGLSGSCLDLLRRMLITDAAQRITMQQILAHPFFLEALPDGALAMNPLILARSHSLGPTETAFLRSVIEKAAINDGDCRLPSNVERYFEASDLQYSEGKPVLMRQGSASTVSLADTPRQPTTEPQPHRVSACGSSAQSGGASGSQSGAGGRQQGSTGPHSGTAGPSSAMAGPSSEAAGSHHGAAGFAVGIERQPVNGHMQLIQEELDYQEQQQQQQQQQRLQYKHQQQQQYHQQTQQHQNPQPSMNGWVVTSDGQHGSGLLAYGTLPTQQTQLHHHHHHMQGLPPIQQQQQQQLQQRQNQQQLTGQQQQQQQRQVQPCDTYDIPLVDPAAALAYQGPYAGGLASCLGHAASHTGIGVSLHASSDPLTQQLQYMRQHHQSDVQQHAPGHNVTGLRLGSELAGELEMEGLEEALRQEHIDDDGLALPPAKRHNNNTADAAAAAAALRPPGGTGARQRQGPGSALSLDLPLDLPLGTEDDSLLMPNSNLGDDLVPVDNIVNTSMTNEMMESPKLLVDSGPFIAHGSLPVGPQQTAFSSWRAGIDWDSFNAAFSRPPSGDGEGDHMQTGPTRNGSGASAAGGVRGSGRLLSQDSAWARICRELSSGSSGRLSSSPSLRSGLGISLAALVTPRSAPRQEDQCTRARANGAAARQQDLLA